MSLPKARAGRRGFTLLEVLVALAVFGIAAVTMVKVVGGSARNLEMLEQSQLAGMVAHNRVVEVQLSGERGNAQGETSFAGRDYRWQLEFHDTPDPDISRVEVRVSRAGEDSVLVERIAFVRRGR